MLIDGLTMLEGSSAQNLTVAKGTSFPSLPTEGELFYRTDGVNEGLYVYNGESWVQSGGNAFDPSGNQTITGTWAFSNAVAVGTPTAANHAVTKSYADSLASGVDPKDSVRAATTANITLSGTQTIDGVALAVGDRVLVKNQTLGTQNGLYVVAAGAWTRTSDFDGSPSTEVTSGAYVFVTGGSTNGQKGFILTTNDPITVGSTVLSWTQFSGSPTVVDLTGATGNLSVNNLDSGTNASATTFWRGDGIWSTAVTSIAVSGGTTGLTTSGGPITSSGTITLGGTLAIANGGTGQTSAANAINALVPSQSGNAGKFLTTNGTVVSWDDAAGGATTALNGTGAPSPSISTTGLYAGSISSVPTALYVNSSASAGNKAWETRVDNSGRFQINLYNDALSSNPTVFQITRSGQTATALAMTATAITLNGAVTGNSFSGVGSGLTALNADNLSSGTVDTARLGTGTANNTTFLRGDGTWSIPTATAATVLHGTTSFNSVWSVASTAVWAGTKPGGSAVAFSNSTATSGNKLAYFQKNTDGSFAFYLATDTNSSASSVFSIARSGNTATLTTLNATGINLVVGASGLQLNGSAGTSGQVLTSQGSAAPIWATPSVTSLNGTGGVTFNVSASAVRAGTASSEPAFQLTQASAAADNRVTWLRVNTGGTLRWSFATDANAEVNWMTVTRSGNVATNITLTGTAVTLAARTDFGKSYTELNNTATATASTTIDCSLGNIFTVTMSASITTLAFSNIPASGRAYNMTLILKQDATGGRSITWPASVKWPSATAPTLSGANKTDIVTLLTTDGGTIWYATVGGQNF